MTLLLREKNQQIEKLEAELEKQQDCRFTSTELNECNLLEQFDMTDDSSVETECISIQLFIICQERSCFCAEHFDSFSLFFPSTMKSFFVKSLSDAFLSIVSATPRP